MTEIFFWQGQEQVQVSLICIGNLMESFIMQAS